MSIEKVPLVELLDYLDDVIPAKPEGAFGPFSGRELLVEVRRRMTLAERLLSRSLKPKNSPS